MASCAAGRVSRAMVIALAIACEAPPAPVERPEPAADVTLEGSSRDGPLTLSVRRVSAEGWRGRLVVASFAPEQRRARVVPSERVQPLDAIVGPLAPAQPFAAIDGGFYDPHGQPMGLVRTGGRDLHPLRPEGGSGVLVVEGGTPRMVHRDAYAGAAATEALQSIDRLLEGGRVLVTAGAADRRAARSAVALDARGHLHLAVAFDERAVAADEDARVVLGERSATTGPTLREWAELLARPAEDGGVGAVDALGLDGGISTALTVKSAARALRVEGYRGTTSAVLVSADPER